MREVFHHFMFYWLLGGFFVLPGSLSVLNGPSRFVKFWGICAVIWFVAGACLIIGMIAATIWRVYG